MISPRGASPIASSNKDSPLTLVLASESPRRKALLAQAGLVPSAIIPAHIDESVRPHELPRLHALRLVSEKAASVCEGLGDAKAIVLAADTVVAIGRRILPKAETDDDVRRCLALLSGRRHRVFTAIAAKRAGGTMRTRIALTQVAFCRLDGPGIEAYVQSREGLGKAGGYAIQGRAETFVRSINGSYSNVVGLPLFETVALLKGCGFSIP